MRKKIYLVIAYLLTHAAYVLAQNTVVITDADLVGGETYNWTADNEYILDGYVFLEAGGVLNIAPGTVIKGMSIPSTSDAASALIISRDAMIVAEGTAENPIIFTTSLDDVSVVDDVLPSDNSLWGGLVILGNAPGGFLNEATEFNIEGIPTEAYGEKALYGGSDPMDNSGVLRYVSIRHGGNEIAPDNEINGLTLGSVGAGTTIDYIEVFANKDDGIEFFGGTVNVKHAVVSYCGDEAFDYDQSWAGKGQWLFSINDVEYGERGYEIDGSEAPSLNPKTVPVFSNVTQIGTGSTSGTPNNDAFRMKSDGSGHFHNSIWTEFSGSSVRIDDQETYDRFAAGDIVFNNNVWYNFGDGGNDVDSIVDIREGDVSAFIAHLTDNGNQLTDPFLRGISRETDGGLDPRPAIGAPILTQGVAVEDDFFTEVAYIGAFGAENWAAGWTALSEYGIFGDLDVTVPSQEIVITDADLVGGETYNWTANNTYILDGYVFLEDGGVLNIAPGTVIKGMSIPSTTDAASALIISRGAQINAIGTAEQPIIFTTTLDDVTVVDDVLPSDNSLWGGLVILGRAPGGFLNEATEFNIEGIPTEAYGDKALYGGDDPMDNSGVLKYVSIRHGGNEIAPDNEINGLTLGSVGAGTEIDYIEVFANKDDGIEFFGGTVNIKHAVVGFCGDEAYDYDQSWAGKGQWLFSINDVGYGERGYEIDGSEAPSLNPKTVPVFSNVTQIGTGSTSGTPNNDGFRMKSDGSGLFYNSIWTEFSGSAVRIDDQETYDRFAAGDIAFVNNVWYNFGSGGNDLEAIMDIRAGDAAAFVQHVADNDNLLTDPYLRGISRNQDGGLDPRPAIGAPVLSMATDVNDDFFTDVSYVGAFGETNWAAGWTAMSEYGIFGDLDVTAPGTDFVIKDEDLVGGETYNWTANNTYTLDGYVFLEEGGVLNIAPGTVVKALSMPSTTDAASALIISRGAQIYAEGTAESPIIFTSSLDDLSTTDDVLPSDNSLWGGLVILGRAPGGFLNEATEFNIEGIPTEAYGDKALYGGDDPMDNSGVLKYISIRHGGNEIAPDNEINGLTLGSVGAGTEIDYVEVFANKDDGIELFGGTVNIKHAVVGFCGDEAYDYDQSWAGKGQFLFSINDVGYGERGYEIDGSEAPSLNPKTVPVFSNVTQIGTGADSGTPNNDAFRMKSDGSGQFYNSIWTEFSGSAVRIDDQETYDRFASGDISFTNNVWFNFGDGGNDLDSIMDIREGDVAAFIQHIADNNNQLIDPQLRGISRLTDGGLDPRPAIGAPILSMGTSLGDDFFEDVSFIGAFGEENWAYGWTALTEYGIFGDLQTTKVDYQTAENGLSIRVKNPVVQEGTLFLDLPESTQVKMYVFDLTGRMVVSRDFGFVGQGSQALTFGVDQLETGMYVIIADTGLGAVSSKLSVIN